MALGSRVRALEEEKAGLMERLEEEEEKTRELTRQIQNHTQQVYTHLHILKNALVVQTIFTLILSFYFFVPMQLSDLKRQTEEVNSAVEAGEEARRKMQRELENAIQRERAKEEEKERIERQKERLREEIEDMTIALQRERQNCTALEKRQKKFDQVK